MNIILKIRENRHFMQMFPVILLVLLYMAFAILTGGQFATPSNLITMLNQCLILGTMATGAVFIFGTGNINLSMGGTAALSAVIGGYAYLATKSILIMLLVCIISGIILSYVAVVLSQLTKMPILTITTVTMMLYPAVQNWMLGATTISVPYIICSKLQKMQIPLIVFLIFLLICVFLFYFTSLGRKIRFQGDNEICAKLTGFAENSIYSIVFIIGGIACGLAAFSTIVRTSNVSITTLSTGNMNVVLSIVIGGMPIFGGYKTQPYAGILGAAVLVVLEGGLLMVGVDSSILQALKGIIFMLFVVISWERPKGLTTKGA